jgi:hypothetical protein
MCWIEIYRVIKKSLCTWRLQYASFLSHYLVQSDCLAADRQGQGDTRLPLTSSVIHNSNYVIMVTDLNYFKYFCMFLYCNQVHRDLLITLWKAVWETALGLPIWIICNVHYTVSICTGVFPPMPPHVPYGLRCLPSRLWLKCNRLLRLGRPWGTVTLSQWGGWWVIIWIWIWRGLKPKFH